MSLSVEDLLVSNRKYYEQILSELSHSRSGLIELEKWKVQLPNVLLERYEADKKNLSIDLKELSKLMDWKLKKGKFRPTLKKLISQNSNETVVSTTKAAFEILLSSKDDAISEDDYLKLIKKSMNIVTGLRGVGPATGALILSLLNKVTKLAPPFYSDESAWFIFKSNGQEDIKLKYTLSEYMSYLKYMYQLNPELKFDFTDLEQGAWSLELKEQFLPETVVKRPKSEEPTEIIADKKKRKRI